MSLSSSSHTRSPFRDPWAALELLIQKLGEAANTSQSVAAAVAAARDAIGADAAYWYSRTAAKAGGMVGVRAFPPDAAAALARELLAHMDPARDVIRWTNPKGVAGDAMPDAALLVAGPRTHGCIVAVNFDPARPFDDGDAKAVRMALKMMLAQRAQSQAGTKQLLNGLLHSLTTIIDAKDPYTAGHSERVARIAVLLARQIGLSEAQQGDVYLAGLLHDVGKIGLPDEILRRPGRLTAEEMDEVRRHPVIGERIVASIKPFDRLRPAVRGHHERWDGAGYPDKIVGDAIDPVARVLTVADACDAMMSPRRYRAARTPMEIDAVFHQEIGKQFDPAVVRAFMTVRHDIYPPIYQKGIGESAFHAIENIVDHMADGSVLRMPVLGGDGKG